MRRAAWLCVLALVLMGCSGGGGGGPVPPDLVMCSVPDACHSLGECCGYDPNGKCDAVCEPCASGDLHGLRCVPTMTACTTCPVGQKCEPCDAGAD